MFYERLNALCEAAGTNITTMAKEVLKVSNATPTNWKKGVSPKASIVREAAEYFHVSTDYLLGLTDDPSPHKKDMRKLNPDEIQLVDKLRRAAPSMRNAVFRMADAVLVSPNLIPLTEVAGPSFLSTNDENNRLESAEYGQKQVEGNAAAGRPITAVREDDLMASVPMKYMSSRYFIVRAKGDSMIDAGINDGDFCVFQKDAYLDEGKIMLVQVEGSDIEPDVTIKSVYFHDDEIELRSQNPAYDPMYYPASEVRIMGVLAHVVMQEM